MQKRKKKKWMSRARNRAKERTRAEHVKSMGVVVVDRSIDSWQREEENARAA
jgi:tRNA(Arg) A34 adenosine deaminase TadA